LSTLPAAPSKRWRSRKGKKKEKKEPRGFRVAIRGRKKKAPSTMKISRNLGGGGKKKKERGERFLSSGEENKKKGPSVALKDRKLWRGKGMHLNSGKKL